MRRSELARPLIGCRGPQGKTPHAAVGVRNGACRVLRALKRLPLKLSGRRSGRSGRRVRRPVAILDQEFGEGPYLARRMLALRPDHIRTCWRGWMACHDRHECTGGHMFMREPIG